jgi:hypothetical protein
MTRKTGASNMADVFVEWSGGAPGESCGIATLEKLGCAEMHKVHWQESFIAEEGRRLICHFRAPDAESVRMALRLAHIDADSIWTGRIYEGPAPAATNVVVERLFAVPPADAEAALELMETEWLIPHRLKLARAIVSCNRQRVICVCEAPQDLGGMFPPRDRAGHAWACRRVAA